MNSPAAFLATLMELPESERFEIAMAVLDQSSPAGITENEIVQEAGRRQDELESGKVADIGFDELVAGLNYRPRSLAQ
jgi:hypothetical protein